jgi:glycosyltransferase involved in cell wall biosynthesis
MRVLFVYRFLTMGGVETVLRARLDGLARHGCDAHAWFLFDGPGRVLFDDTDRVHVGGLLPLERHLSQEHYDLVSSIDTEETLSVMERLDPPPVFIMEVHTPYAENLEYLRALHTESVRAFLVPSSYQEGVARERLPEGVNVQVAPNPLAASFAMELRDSNPGPPRPVVAWVGRLDPVKNWAEFIALGGELRRKEFPVEFWLIGRSPGRDQGYAVYQKAADAGILDCLRWFREVPHVHMPAFYDAVRSSGGVLVSTSRGESFGMTIAEAMARGCAIVAPESGPFAEFMQPGEHGLVYALGSPVQAASQVQRLLTDHSLRTMFGRRGRGHILARHGPDPALAAFTHLLHEILAQA